MPALLYRPQAYKWQEASTETLRVTYPPSTWLGDADEITWEGTLGGTAVGAWHPVSATHYLYLLQDDGTGRFVGPDPGDFEASLAGMTGVAINLPNGPLSETDVSAQVETDWNAAAVPGIVATDLADGRVTFVGTLDAAAAAAAGPGDPWLSRGAGTSAYGAIELNAGGVAGQAVDFRSACQVEEAALPTTLFRVVGLRARGTNLQMAVAIDGAGRGDPEGGTAEVSVYFPGGGSDWNTLWLTPGECFEVDGATLNEMFLISDGDGALSEIYGGGGQNLGLQLDAGGDNVFRLGASQGALVEITTPIGPLSGGNFFFGLSMQVIIQVPPYYGDGAWGSWGGVSPSLHPTLPNATTMDTIMPAFGFNFPAVVGLSIESLQINLPAHDPALDDQLRVEIWENAGGLSLITMVGDTIFDDVGPTSGSDTGWVEMLSSPIDIDGGGEYRISLKGEPTGAPGDTTFGFELGGFADEVERPGWPLGALMQDSEIEYTAANGEVNIDFDPQVATSSPLNPNSSAIFPGNAGGLAVRLGHSGIIMEANP